MLRTAMALVVMGLVGCGDSGPEENPRECPFYAFDLINHTDDTLFLSFDSEDPKFFDVELTTGNPVEVYVTSACTEKEVPVPEDFPAMTGEWGGATVTVDVGPEEWSPLKNDSVRGYEYYRAEIQEAHLIAQ
jgi:hypothetical protein